jgi:hypothetical protein
MSSQAVWVWATGGPGALLVSPFNVEMLCAGWRFHPDLYYFFLPINFEFGLELYF